MTLSSKLFCCLVVVTPLVGALAAQVDQEELARRRDAKLAEPWVKAGGWIVDYEMAKAESKRSGKPIFAFFSRSYSPCPPCLALEKQVMKSALFEKFSREVVPFLHVTSLVKGEPHPELLIEKGGTGFPFLCYMNSQGHLLARHERRRTVADFRRTLDNEVREYLVIEKRAQAGDTQAQYLHLLRRLDLGVSYAVARKMADDLKDLGSERKARLLQRLTNHEYDELREKANRSRQYGAAAKRCAAMMNAGREPESSRRVIDFWGLVILHARKTEDPALFERALVRFDQHSGDTPRVRAFVAERQAELQALRARLAARGSAEPSPQGKRKN